MKCSRRAVGACVLFAVSLSLISAGGGSRSLVRLDEAGGRAVASESERRFVEKQRRQFTPRPDYWPFENHKGLAAYGHVGVDELDSPDVLILPNSKGSIHIRRGSSRDQLPAELRSGGGDYFIVQLAPRHVEARGALQVQRLLTERGASIVDYVPNNAFLARIAPKDRHHFDDPALFQYVTPFLPADRIHPATGRRALLNPERVISDWLDLVVRIMAGEPTSGVEEAVSRLGGEIVQRHEVAGERYLSVRMRAIRLPELAHESSIHGIWEAPEYVTMNLVTSAQVEIGRFLDPRDFGDFVLPFRDAGVDGGGIYSGPAVDFTVPGTSDSPIAFSSDLSNYSVAPQFLGVADNGLTIDSAAFSHDNANPCRGSGNCVSSIGGLNVGPSHRKVEVYTRGIDVNNDDVTDDATSSGDFLTCDSVRSGGHTHGSIAAGGAAANPSGGPMGLGHTYSDVDAIDQFTSFFNDSREADLSLDGQARGARVIFQDIAITPVPLPLGCAGNYLSDVDAGDIPAARLQDMVFRRDLNLSNSAPHARGARITLLAFGNPNFDDNLDNGQGNYGNGADGIDAFLFANRRVTTILPVGNDGLDWWTGRERDPLYPADPNVQFGPDQIQVNDLATGKNPVTVGANWADSLRAALDPSETIANFTSKGPATFASRRGAPVVVAPGVDVGNGREGREGHYIDDYFVSSAQVVSFDNQNDADEGIEDVVIQGETGTSVAASKVAGAALQIRDYFAKGFYPTGSMNASDRVADMSGALVKALLVNSSDFASEGPLLQSCVGRGPLKCSTEQGFGKVELANTLPLANYRAERRAGSSNLSPVTNVPEALLVADEYFDGGLRRDPDAPALDGSRTGIGVVPYGGSVSFDVFRRHGYDQFRVSLAWYDAVGELLRNNLDLEVIDGDYDLRSGGLCGALPNGGNSPQLCGNCRAEANEQGSINYYDADGSNPYIRIYKGNQFTTFGGQFSSRAECDTASGAVSADFINYPFNEPDRRNTTESVMLHYLGDPAFFGQTRSGGSNGRYRIRVKFPLSASSTPVPFAPIIAPGDDHMIETTPSGDDTVALFDDGMSIITAGPDGIVQSAAAPTDVQLVGLGSFGQPFALAVAGPVASQRQNSVISLDRDVYDCSEASFTMRVADNSRCVGAGTPACAAREATPAAAVSANTKVQVLDGGGNLMDEESGFTFIALKDDPTYCSSIDLNTPCASSYRVARDLLYNSSPRSVQNIGSRPGAANPIIGNGIIEVSDGWIIKAIYDDKTPAMGPVGGSPEPEDAVTTARVKCRPLLGTVLLSVPAENSRRTVITGGCDIGRTASSRGDLFMDAGESVIYQVGFANQSSSAPVNLRATLDCVDPVPGGADPCSNLTIVSPVAELGVVPQGREGIAAWTIRVGVGVATLPTADRAVDMRVTFTSRSTDSGGTLATQSFTSREALQADIEILRYNTDFPGGGTLARDLNRDGRISTVPDGSSARNRELMTYQPLNNPGNPNSAIAAMMPWHFDTGPPCSFDIDCENIGGGKCTDGQCRNGGFTAFRAADSKPGGPGSSQNSLAWFYGTAGGCGWQSQNKGVVSTSTTAPKGVWHAGHGPILGFGVANSCPMYVNPTDPLTSLGTEFIHDVLDSPIMEKVHQGLDARGMPFDLRMEGIGWNEESDINVGTTALLEVDANLDDDGPVVLGDSYAYLPPYSVVGRDLGGRPIRTFGPLRDSDSSIANTGIANGDEVGVIGTAPTQLVETNFLERPLMAYPVWDADTVTRGFQSNLRVDDGPDPNDPAQCQGFTGYPCIPGRCENLVCMVGGDALIGTACTEDFQCMGPGTGVGHTTPWGPVRNVEVDLSGSFEDFRGASGIHFGFELGWHISEGGLNGGRGLSIDDMYLEWSEQHPADQSMGSANDCATISTRPGANPDARQCASLTFERLTLHNCTTGLRVTLVDDTPALAQPANGCSNGDVAIVVRSAQEPGGEMVCLSPRGGGLFEGTVKISAVSDQDGILFVNSTAGENLVILASNQDPECDQDGDGVLAENNPLDLDGDSTPNAGADGIAGFGGDDDNCYSATLGSDIYNPAGLPQRDNDGSGTITAADCPVAGQPHGRSAITSQCDWDGDGLVSCM